MDNFNNGSYPQDRENGSAPQQVPPTLPVNKAEELNKYLFEYKADGSDGKPLNSEKEKRSNGILKRVALIVCATLMAFLGAFYGMYYTVNSSVFKDSEFFAAFLAKWSGVTENRVEVDYIITEHTGENIELADAILNDTVLVRTVTKNTTTNVLEPLSHGSGVIYSHTESSGYTLVITNYHVIENGGDILIETLSGDRYYATVKATDAQTDLALLEFTSDKKLTAAVQGDSDKLKYGQSAAVAGNPLGHGFGVSFGYIAQPKATTGDASDPQIQLDISVNPGNSGGGVFNSQGHLIGIVVSKASGENVDGIGYAIPINLVNDVVNDLLAFGYVQGRPALGITVTNILTEAQYKYYAENELSGLIDPNKVTLGVYIIESKNSQLKVGDRIVSIDGITVITNENVSKAISKLSPGTAVEIKVSRYVEGQPTELTLQVLLGTRDWAD